MARVRRLREEKKLTQADIARRLNVSRLTYIHLESGEKKPTLNQIVAISSALGVSTKELLFPDEEVPQYKGNMAKYRQMCQFCITYGGSVDDGKITKTKLAKLLYLIDFSWFAKTGESMSGMSYRALPRGPVAEEFFQVTDDMFESGQVQIESKGPALMFSVVEPPSRTELLDEELRHISEVAKEWREADTQMIVDFAHSQVPWNTTRPDEEISYELAYEIPEDQLY